MVHYYYYRNVFCIKSSRANYLLSTNSLNSVLHIITCVCSQRLWCARSCSLGSWPYPHSTRWPLAATTSPCCTQSTTLTKTTTSWLARPQAHTTARSLSHVVEEHSITKFNKKTKSFLNCSYGMIIFLTLLSTQVK